MRNDYLTCEDSGSLARGRAQERLQALSHDVQGQLLDLT